MVEHQYLFLAVTFLAHRATRKFLVINTMCIYNLSASVHVCLHLYEHMRVLCIIAYLLLHDREHFNTHMQQTVVMSNQCTLA